MQKPSSIIGNCGLCKAEAVGLCQSDLLPKSVTRTIIKSEPSIKANHNPFLVTGGSAVQMNYKVAEYFLCANCEHRLNQSGENWVLAKAVRSDGSFALRDMLRNAPVIASGRKAQLIDARAVPEIDLQKLTYFGASIFWKAAAREWRVLNQISQLEFGPYEDRLRLFLLGEEAFPETACLVIAISGDSKPFLGAFYAAFVGRSSGAREFRFSIPGISFWLYQGNVSRASKEYCVVHEKRLCLAPNLNDFHIATALTGIPRS